MRRFTRLTNAFSNKFDNHVHALSLYFGFYNFCRIHKTLRMSPAMAAGVTDRLWSLKDVLARINAMHRHRLSVDLTKTCCVSSARFPRVSAEGMAVVDQMIAEGGIAVPLRIFRNSLCAEIEFAEVADALPIDCLLYLELI